MRLLRAEYFVDEMKRYELPWQISDLPARLMELLDEAGLLRPRYRLRFPQDYAHYRAARIGRLVDAIPSDDTCERYATLDELVDSTFHRHPQRDPAKPSALEEPSPLMTPFLCSASAEEEVHPSEWHVPVHTNERGYASTYPHVVSVYADWQIVRCFSAMAFCMRTILTAPEGLRAATSRSLSQPPPPERELARHHLPGFRLLGLAHSLEQEDWIDSLSRYEDCEQWFLARLDEPSRHGWSEGVPLTREERVQADLPRFTASVRSLAGPWLSDRRPFTQRIGFLLQLHEELEELQVPKLLDLVDGWILMAVRWARQIYNVTSEQIDSEVGSIGTGRLTINHVLRPSWKEAKTSAISGLRAHVDHFNSEIQVLRLTSQDPADFLAFLDRQGLWSWQMELASLLKLRRNDDAVWDKQFLSLRSLATFLEPILSSLAERYGSDSDRRAVANAGVKESMGVFISGRDGWRESLRKALVAHYDRMTDTRGPQSTLESRLDSIASVTMDSVIGGAARLILARAAVRHFGSHRYFRDFRMLHQYGGTLFRAVVYTPLIYWKIATSGGDAIV